MWSGHFLHTAVWIADSAINRATAIIRLNKCKHRCRSSKYTYPLAVWEILLLTRICWFMYFMTPSILLLLPVTQGDYMLAWSPWEQWTNLRCFHCHRQAICMIFPFPSLIPPVQAPRPKHSHQDTTQSSQAGTLLLCSYSCWGDAG